MEKLRLFTGPCVLESEGLVDEVASFISSELKPFMDDIEISFKGSFDKANRTSINSYRGPGIEKGLKMMEEVNKKYGLTTITDFHMPSQAEEVASVVHTLQVPAFLCRQTDMIVAGAEACKKHGRTLKVKKGQFLSPEETENIVTKASTILPKDQILLTERGTSFGYQNLIVDMSSFQTMKSFGVKTIHDATHCVQRPGGQGTSTGGKREQILVLAKAALAAGADGLFMEIHPDPPNAKSDSATSLEMKKLPEYLTSLLKIYKARD
jgi:2-dehydro-3-deoxyphosphooctonate aldolase (KDO 8-P synthase)